MNPKEFFYKEYYTHSITVNHELRRFKLDKPVNGFDAVKEHNAPIIADANKILKEFKLEHEDYACLVLQLNSENGFAAFPFTATYPGLLIGTGYTHQSDNAGEFKLGFYFDHTTGLPCIPGSSIKGVLRSMFPQLGGQLLKIPSDVSEIQQSKINYITEKMGWMNETNIKEKVHQLELAIFDGIDLTETIKKKENEYKSIYHRFIFYNAYISNAKNDKIFETDTITPHGNNPLKNPTPLNFLKIRPGVEFTFQLQLQDINELKVNKEDVKNLFISILKDIGIGAKTNVGYGQFQNPII